MIVLKYTESFKKRRSGNGIYITVAICLIAVGAAAWFALSSLSDFNKNEDKGLNDKEYNNDNSSYIESTPFEEITESTADSVTDEPYKPKPQENTVVEEKKIYVIPVEGKVIKKHNDSEVQFSKTYGDMRIHLGIDIACKTGTSVSACSDGTVEEISENGILGKVVTIAHSDGIKTVYASVDNLKIEKGSKVKAGDIIGEVSVVPSECNDESHLHFEVYQNEKPCNPLVTLGLE